MSVGGLRPAASTASCDKSCCLSKWLFLLLVRSRWYRTWSWLWKVQSMIWHSIHSIQRVVSFYFHTVHRDAFCQFPFRWIYYCHSSKSTGKETGKMYFCGWLLYILWKGSLLYWNFILTDINLSHISYKFFYYNLYKMILIPSYCRNKSYVSVQFFSYFFTSKFAQHTWRKMPCVNSAIAMLLKLPPPPRTLAVSSARRHQVAAADLTGPRARKCMPSIPVMPTVMWFVGVAVISYHKTTRVIAVKRTYFFSIPLCFGNRYLKFISSQVFFCLFLNRELGLTVLRVCLLLGIYRWTRSFSFRYMQFKRIP